MIRLVRLMAAVGVLTTTPTAHALSFPSGAVACLCAVDPGDPIFTGQEDAVFIGTAQELRGDGNLRFIVERWFVGGDPVTWEIPVYSGSTPMDGGFATSSCSVEIQPGNRMLLATRVADGVYLPGACAPHVLMNADNAGMLLNAAVARFGQGIAPGQEPDPRDTLPDDPTLAGLAAGAVGILVLVVVIAVVASARQRREEA
jgi:hypothetical protein